MIWIFSNVKFSENQAPKIPEQDTIVWVNKAVNAPWYAEHPQQICIRRTPEDRYGKDIVGAHNFFCFGGEKDHTIPASMMRKIRDGYDWNYPIENGKTRSPTTGFMVAKYVALRKPNEEITLVNFGNEVQHSTYRCPWHNWKFEAQELAKYRHVYTEPRITRNHEADNDRMQIVYAADENYVSLLKMSAETVKRFNPNAEITVLAATPLESGFKEIIVDTAGCALRRKSTDRVTAAAYLKLFIPEYLNKNRAIYLDCDTLCRGSLRELWGTPVDYLGICHSHNTGVRQQAELGLNHYGLSAMLLMNLDALRRIRFTQTLMRCCRNLATPQCGFFQDETTLNAVYSDIMTMLPLKWCRCVNRNYSKYPDEIPENNAVVLHYIGGQHDRMRIDYKDLKNG